MGVMPSLPKVVRPQAAGESSFDEPVQPAVLKLRLGLHRSPPSCIGVGRFSPALLLLA